MPRFVALLRGVNVGKGKRVPMADFRAMLGGMGYTAVTTLLNSGNAVFTSGGHSGARHAAAIAAAVEATFGVVTPVIVKSAAELDTILATAPMQPSEDQHSRFLVAFGPDAAALAALEPLAALARAPERLEITAHAAYLHCPAGILQSAVGEAMLGKAGKGVTTRNWATVLKIQAALRAG
ncbi:MAG: DUF1697 domain-containing protein [Gemmatimonadales bacterium]